MNTQTQAINTAHLSGSNHNDLSNILSSRIKSAFNDNIKSYISLENADQQDHSIGADNALIYNPDSATNFKVSYNQYLKSLKYQMMNGPVNNL
eukprot:CAMPEP_0170549494 /NCGR_PEP_ID=MMETSP0211-20121228/7645_1 /TAXON_ID=311385 /ORGANISM="Pseudokeronopsis sp., Strain OXSARD2" /LENGTH=92 /DNA_ID=CAMNT_0010855539 /DNA_START=149 /DNA_END=427 /DNA_ORIENTATION=+